MRFLVAGILAAIALTSPLSSATAQAAPIYPWCAHYMMKGGPHNCGFVSLEECLSNVNGIGGSCQQNPYYLDQPPPRIRKVRHIRRHATRG